MRRRGGHDDAAARHHGGRVPHDVREGENGAAEDRAAGEAYRPPERGGAEKRDLLPEDRWTPDRECLAGGSDLSDGGGKERQSVHLNGKKPGGGTDSPRFPEL